MITGRSHPVIARRSRACPVIVHPGSAVAPVRCPAAHPPHPSPARLPPLMRPRPDRLRQAHPGPGVRLRLPPHRRQTCSATTLRRRRDEWITLGVADRLRRAVLDAYDRLFGLELEHLAVDACITKAPWSCPDLVDTWTLEGGKPSKEFTCHGQDRPTRQRSALRRSSWSAPAARR